MGLLGCALAVACVRSGPSGSYAMEAPGVAAARQPTSFAPRDSDAEGTIAVRDACVDEAERWNGYLDDDGCLDELPEALRSGLASVWYEESDIAALVVKNAPSGRLRTELDRVAQTLREHPDVRIEIIVHTDDRAPESPLWSNRGSVIADLIGQYVMDAAGQPSVALDIRYAGPDEPLAGNRTAAGRRRNRRIEFRLAAEGR